VAAIKELTFLLIISFIISYSMKPILNILLNLGVNKKISSVLIISIIILLLVSCITLIIPSILKESVSFQRGINDLETLIDSLYMKLKPISENKAIYTALNNINDKINGTVVNLMESIFQFTMNIGGFLISIAVIPIISYYFLVDGQIIGNKFFNVFPVKCRKLIKRIWVDIDRVLGKYIASQFYLCLIIGVLTFIVLMLLKIQFPIFLSLLNAFMNIIPYFGPIFGAIPCVLTAMLISPKIALWTAFWLYLIQQMEGNILSPKITGDSINMHPLVVIILLIIGGKIGGFCGMILAIPIGVILFVIYEDINYYIF